ncbi:hypothetical protein [Streptomyces sp. URMC 129]|uniref:hypothetical protein n=1 Tax=Streptomyces sp. URMC 129 TaxID=3423407 RepID=UPI003F1DE08E
MSESPVSRGKRYGRDRRYVHLPDGTTVAWFDRQGEFLQVLVAEHRDAAPLALAPHRREPARIRGRRRGGADRPGHLVRTSAGAAPRRGGPGPGGIERGYAVVRDSGTRTGA